MNSDHIQTLIDVFSPFQPCWSIKCHSMGFPGHSYKGWLHFETVFALINIPVFLSRPPAPVHARSTNAQHLRHPPDEQIRQPWPNMQVCATSSLFFRPSPFRVCGKSGEVLHACHSARGRQRLVWSNPPVSARLSTSDCSGSGLFCTTLTITNATVNETGQYRCYYKDLKVEDGKTAAAVYVFVHGTTPCSTSFSHVVLL